MTEIDNSKDILNSKDIEDRIDELEAERGAIADELEDAEGEQVNVVKGALLAWDASDEAEELRKLKAFRDQLEPYCEDWHHGETLIRDSYFKDYAQELAEDIGAINRDAQWPTNCIDWNTAARELQMDYTPGDFDGVTYWAR